MSSKNREIENFKNPTDFWSYDGSFSVELISGAPKNNVPPSAQIEGNTIKVTNGRIGQSMGGIQLFSGDQPFKWGYKFLKAIRDGKGNLLWVNRNYQKMQ